MRGGLERSICEGDLLFLLRLLTAFVAYILVSQKIHFPTRSPFSNIKYMFCLPHPMSPIDGFSYTFLSCLSLTYPCAYSGL